MNVLLYAFRADSPGHTRYREWLHSVVNADQAYGMSPQVLASVMRIATHPRIYAHPSGFEEAAAFASVLVEPPNCQIVQPGPRHWEIFCDLCRRANAAGNLVQDAWLAAIAIENGCEWVTVDRDYARFEGLRWRAPL